MGWLKSGIADWRTLCHLSRQEKWMLAVSILLLPLVVLAHRLFGLSRVQWALDRFLPYHVCASFSQGQSIRLACSISRIVRIAATRGLCHATCLQQSVLLHWVLAKRGIVSDVRIGVSKRNGKFEAHAWVECLGYVVNDCKDVAVQYSPFPRRISGTLTDST